MPARRPRRWPRRPRRPPPRRRPRPRRPARAGRDDDPEPGDHGGGRSATTAPVSVPTTCPTWSKANAMGAGPAPLVEVSGLAVGRRNPSLLWTHNDSGDSARIFAINQQGQVVTEVTVAGRRRLRLGGHRHRAGPGGRRPAVDLGGRHRRQPPLPAGRHHLPLPRARPRRVTPAQLTVRPALDVTYPDRPNNVESLMVDPVSGDGFLVGKDVAAEDDRRRLPPPTRRAAQRRPPRAATGGQGRRPARSAGWSDGGGHLARRDARPHQQRPPGLPLAPRPGEPVADVLAAAPTAPCDVPIGGGEAAAFSVDGRHLWPMDEGAGAVLRRYDRLAG